MKEQVGIVGSNKCNTGGFHSISFLEVPGNAKQKMEHYTSVLTPAMTGTSALPQPSSAFLVQTMARDRQLSWNCKASRNQSWAPTGGEQQHSLRTTSHSRYLTGCSNKLATACVSQLGVSVLHLLSDCPGVILDPIPFLLLAHRLSCLN